MLFTVIAFVLGIVGGGILYKGLGAGYPKPPEPPRELHRVGSNRMT
jgi:hypothetical protein